jgi:hypothetical protein
MAEKFYSSRLLNYVERVDVGGYAKTAFYTEVNTNLKPGDKIFILNGNYDSDEFIDQDRYAKYVDGYRVISIDRCRIVLDIDYVGLKPYETDNIENFIKIWNVKSLRDLLYYDSISVDSYNDRRVSKFEWRLSNNILFSPSTYNVTRPDTSTYSLDVSNNFWAKRSNGKWQNITSDFNSDTFSISPTASGSYFSTGYNQINNGRLFIYGEDFTYNNNLFRQRNIYKFQNGEWIIDIKYQQPVISKLNFRDGRFRGNHFDGVWGTYQKSLSWSGSQSNWLSGAFVNSTWLNGNLNSKSTIASQSFYAQIDHTGLPIQTSDFSNNKGQGYNYILDSNIRSAIISDGNFINCNIGNTISSTFSAVDDYFDSVDNFNLVTKGGFYNFCDIWSSKIDDASILDSRVYNSNLTNTRMLNSQFFDSVGAGEFNDENGIKVLAADIYSYIPNLNAGLPEPNVDKIKGVLKLYISESDLMRLDAFDNFYITKVNKGFVINSLTSDQRVLLPYETKYILDRFWNNDFSQDLLLGSIKNPSDNKYKPYVTATGSNYYNTFQLSGVTFSSIDLELGRILAHYYQGGAAGSLVPSNPTYSVVETERVINHLNVNNLFKDTFLKNADFVSGVVENTEWLSGALINRQSNIISTLPNNKLSISVNGSNLDIQVFSTQSYYDDSIRIGKSIWLDSIYNGTSSVNISGRYKIQNIQISGGIVTLTVQPKNGIVVGSLSSDFYFDSEVNPNFMSVNSVILRNSKITSGLFKRSLISNSIFENELFDNTDRNLNPSNVDLLRISKTVFKNNSNTIKSGLFYRDHFFGGTWSNAIAYEVVWKNAVFGSGIFKSGYWKSGTFTSGKFIESSDIIKTTLSFSTPTEYKNWTDGTFNGGEFEKSVWKSGTFNNGKFFNSDWYTGIWNNGILGDPNIPFDKTTMANKPLFDLTSGATFTVWNDGLVESALVGGSASIYWYSGKFNNGLFTSNGTTQSAQSIWHGGEFNGGEFTKLAKWKNGNFNGGQFDSYYGWTFSGLTDSQYYGWENGNFNGGKFGNANYATNSIWFNGVFNDGIFQGRVWNDGIFNKGRFIGGATWSPRIYENNFVNSFTNSFYGLWRNGTVIDVKTNLPSENKFYSIRKRVSEERRESVDVQFTKSLWLNGTFSSNSGIFDTSVWLGGRFNSGKFINSVFNPYVNRSPFYTNVVNVSSFDKNNSTVWNNGEFVSGNFYFSEWKNGIFQNGTMSGAIWRNGTWNYGDANNIFWEDGRWRNGNWDGSPFKVETYGVTGSFSTYQIGPGVNQFYFYSSIQFNVNQKVKIYQGTNITTAIVNSSFVVFSFYGVIVDILSGSPTLAAISKIELVEAITDFQKDLIVRVAQSGGVSASATASIHLINAFTPPQIGPEITSVREEFGNNVPIDFWNTYTFSNASFAGGLGTVNTYIDFKNGVRVATTTNITLSGLQTIDGVAVLNGDRVLVKNQTATASNGVYVATASTWVRAADTDTASQISTYKIGSITYNPGFMVSEGTINGGYVYTQNRDLFAAVSSSTYSITLNTITIPTNPNFYDGVPFRFITVGGITNVNTTQTYYARSISPGSTTFYVIVNNDPLTPPLDLIGIQTSQVSISILKQTLGTQNITFITDGAAIWSNPQLCYIGGTEIYCGPSRTIIGPYDFTNKSNPNWRNGSKPLFILAKGSTASVFSEPVGNGGYYYGEIKYVIQNLGVSSQNGTLSIRYGAYFDSFDGLWKQNTKFYSYSLGASGLTFGVMTFSYSPDGNTINNAFLTTNDQTYVSTGYNRMVGKILSVHPSVNSGSTNQIQFDIYSISVVKYASKYDSAYNNTLYNPFNTLNPTYSTPALLPNSIVKQAVSDTSGLVNLKYGNGTFRSGIWENGVWNNGWRTDQTIMRCLLNSNYFNLTESITSTSTIGSKNVSLVNSRVGIDFIEYPSNIFVISLTCIDGIKSSYSIGDKVSVSNIVAIDDNENRTFIKSFSTIVGINQTTKEIIIRCEAPSKTTRIETDSENHIIMVSKNIWISGAFLNGRFNGIWNYGLFQGYPYITLIENSHWIDGIFDGGTMRGRTASFTYSVNGSISSKAYSMPLVQNFEFFDDNNISVPASFESSNGYKYYENVAQYLSWIDLNYYNTSKTNIGKDSLLFDVEVESDTYEINLNGYPTKDILSSNASFRDLTSTNKKNYSLGYRYKTYQSFIPKSNLVTQFSEPVSNLSLLLPSGITYIKKLFNNFSKYGWTYSVSSSNVATITSNLNSLTSGILKIDLQSATSSILLNNSNINIEDGRYSIIEFQLSNFTGATSYSKVDSGTGFEVTYPSIYLFNDPRSDAPGSPTHQAINIDIVNHITTNEQIKTEYFYNRKYLGMYLYGNISASFRNISFKEVDMIPFFQYATQSQIDDDIKTPYKATAPFIDYKNSNFNFIGSVSISVDSSGNYSIPYSSGIGIDLSGSTSIGSGTSLAPSDVRLKKIINKLSISKSGINIYEFEYNSEPGQRYIGVIAQELLGTQFSSAVIEKNQTLYVDYSKIDVEFKKIA